MFLKTTKIEIVSPMDTNTETRTFIVPVGNLSPDKADARIQEFLKMLKDPIVFDEVSLPKKTDNNE